MHIFKFQSVISIPNECQSIDKYHLEYYTIAFVLIYTLKK